MHYKFPYQVKDDFIKDIIRIESSSFDPEVLCTLSGKRARYNINQESLVLAYDNLKLVGYLEFFPITHKLAERIENEDKVFIDDNLPIMGILPSCPNDSDFYMLLSSVAVLPEYRGRGITKELVKKFYDFISDKMRSGCLIKKYYAYAFTDHGIQFLDVMGLTEIKKIILPETNSYIKLYSS
ncbi:MAG: GNAT family N-acetyltransferase [Defluviitaleaceae bacterium]|nr:GNAT family N-acetyltransferase [Defluviitaleaceae bacterium]